MIVLLAERQLACFTKVGVEDPHTTLDSWQNHGNRGKAALRAMLGVWVPSASARARRCRCPECQAPRYMRIGLLQSQCGRN